MATKEEISDDINRRLDTDISWEELKKEDLEKLVEMLETTELMEKVVKLKGKDLSKEQLDRLVDSWFPGKYAKRML